MSVINRYARGETAAFLASPVLIAFTTLILARVQAVLIVSEGGHYVRPFGICYVIPIALMTVLGSFQAGLFTLALSVGAAVFFLTPLHDNSPLHDTLNLTELFFLCLVGGLIIAGGESMRRNAVLLVEKRESAERERAAAERQQSILRDVLASVTDNRLHLCDNRAELPPCIMPVGDTIAISVKDLRTLREKVSEVVIGAGFSQERCYDLMTAATEAAMNAAVHGGGGEGHVCIKQDDTVQVWVEDWGHGIDMDQLPRATMERGYSTAGTLGHGFWIMLRMADRIWLVTGETGTVVVLEQERVPPPSLWSNPLD